MKEYVIMPQKNGAVPDVYVIEPGMTFGKSDSVTEKKTETNEILPEKNITVNDTKSPEEFQITVAPEKGIMQMKQLLQALPNVPEVKEFI